MLKVDPLKEIGAHRALCVETVRVAAGLKTGTAQRRAFVARRAGIPVDQCGHRGDFTVDGRVLCRAHAQAAALAFVIEHQVRERTDADEIAQPRCGCPSDTVRRVIVEHGTCSMGGRPYGGDI